MKIISLRVPVQPEKVEDRLFLHQPDLQRQELPVNAINLTKEDDILYTSDGRDKEAEFEWRKNKADFKTTSSISSMDNTATVCRESFHNVLNHREEDCVVCSE